MRAWVVMIKARSPRACRVDEAQLWDDYQETLGSVARAFALGFDQWYTEIARDNPSSVYWNHRGGGESTFDTRAIPSSALINGQITAV